MDLSYPLVKQSDQHAFMTVYINGVLYKIFPIISTFLEVLHLWWLMNHSFLGACSSSAGWWKYLWKEKNLSHAGLARDTDFCAGATMSASLCLLASEAFFAPPTESPLLSQSMSLSFALFLFQIDEVEVVQEIDSRDTTDYTDWSSFTGECYHRSQKLCGLQKCHLLTMEAPGHAVLIWSIIKCHIMPMLKPPI